MVVVVIEGLICEILSQKSIAIDPSGESVIKK